MSSYIQTFKRNNEFLNKKGVFRFLLPCYMGNHDFENGSVVRALRFIAEDKEYQIHKIELKKDHERHYVWVICNPSDRAYIYQQLQGMLDNTYRTVECTYFKENVLPDAKNILSDHFKKDAWLDIQDGGYYSFDKVIFFQNNPFFFTTDEDLCYKVMLTLKNSLQTDEPVISFKSGDKVYFHLKDGKVKEGIISTLFHDKVSYVIKSHGKSYLRHKYELVSEESTISKMLKTYY